MIVVMSTRELLACRDFMRLWWARLAGVAASQMMLVAIGWQMYDLTGSRLGPGPGGSAAVSAGSGAGAGGRPCGRPAPPRAHRGAVRRRRRAWWRWRWPRRPSTALSQRTLLLALSVVLGAVRAFQMPAQQALVPLLVPPVLLPRAHGLRRPPACRARSSPGRRWAVSSTWPALRWSMACVRRCSRVAARAVPGDSLRPRLPPGRASQPGTRCWPA